MNYVLLLLQLFPRLLTNISEACSGITFVPQNSCAIYLSRSPSVTLFDEEEEPPAPPAPAFHGDFSRAHGTAARRRAAAAREGAVDETAGGEAGGDTTSVILPATVAKLLLIILPGQIQTSVFSTFVLTKNILTCMPMNSAHTSKTQLTELELTTT